MSLKARISEDMKAAMHAQDKQRLSAIRLLQAAIKQREIDERIELGDAQIIEVIEKMLKQRRDSISQYEAAGRQDLAAAEKFEAALLQYYLPPPPTDEEISALLDQVIQDTGARGLQDMGKVMTALKPRVTGRVDMAALASRVKAKLSV